MNDSRLVSCGLSAGRTDTTNLIVAFRNFAYAPKMEDQVDISAIYNLIYRAISFMCTLYCTTPLYEVHLYNGGQELVCWQAANQCSSVDFDKRAVWPVDQSV
jgi:hypothetical protein